MTTSTLVARKKRLRLASLLTRLKFILRGNVDELTQEEVLMEGLQCLSNGMNVLEELSRKSTGCNAEHLLESVVRAPRQHYYEYVVMNAHISAPYQNLHPQKNPLHPHSMFHELSPYSTYQFFPCVIGSSRPLRVGIKGPHAHHVFPCEIRLAQPKLPRHSAPEVHDAVQGLLALGATL